MLAIQPQQKQEISLETARVPAVEISLIRETFRGSQMTESKVLSTDTLYTSITRKRETITQDAIAQGSANLEQGQSITARTGRRGFPVATISPQMRATPFLGLLEPDRNELPIQSSPNQSKIFSSLTAPIISRALASAIKDLLTESPAEKEKREQQERLANEAQRQELQRLQQAAQAEKSEIIQKTSQRNNQSNQSTNSEISDISRMASSENVETLKAAIALSQSIDNRIAGEPLTNESILEIREKFLNTDPELPSNEYRASNYSLTGLFGGMTDSAIEELRLSYSARGAEGKFMTTVLEALTSESSSIKTLSESQFIINSAPAIFEGVIADLYKQYQISSWQEEISSADSQANQYPHANENQEWLSSIEESDSLGNTVMTSAPTTFSRYFEDTIIDDSLAGFSFSQDLRARASAEIA